MPRAPKKTGKTNGNGENGHISSDEVAKKAYDSNLIERRRPWRRL